MNIAAHPATTTLAGKLIGRADYEDFLFQEAALLDEWRLDEWYGLFLEDATYEVPQAGADDNADSAVDLFYISDSYYRLGHRVARLQKQGNHSEWPRSRCTRMIGNVRILGIDGSSVHVGCNFITHRSKNDITDMFCGHHRYVLKQAGDRIRIASKRSILDLNSLRPQGRVSIIV